MVISWCGESSVEPASAESAAAVNDSKCNASFAKKFSLMTNKLQAAKSSSALSIANDQETVQGQLNHYISELAEAD